MNEEVSRQFHDLLGRTFTPKEQAYAERHATLHAEDERHLAEHDSDWDASGGYAKFAVDSHKGEESTLESLASRVAQRRAHLHGLITKLDPSKTPTVKDTSRCPACKERLKFMQRLNNQGWLDSELENEGWPET